MTLNFQKENPAKFVLEILVAQPWHWEMDSCFCWEWPEVLWGGTQGWIPPAGHTQRIPRVRSWPCHDCPCSCLLRFPPLLTGPGAAGGDENRQDKNTTKPLCSPAHHVQSHTWRVSSGNLQFAIRYRTQGYEALEQPGRHLCTQSSHRTQEQDPFIWALALEWIAGAALCTASVTGSRLVPLTLKSVSGFSS